MNFVDSEESYFTFILGYDLLQDIIKNSTIQECDKIYDFCRFEADMFLKSEEYLNEKYSGYEMISEWVENNKKQIKEDYKVIVDNEQKIYDGNMVILDKGFRREQPVALIEKTLGNNEKQYIVAINYKMVENKLSWGYAYYYDNKIDAEKDYEKVISNKSLYKNNER